MLRKHIVEFIRMIHANGVNIKVKLYNGTLTTRFIVISTMYSKHNVNNMVGYFI